MYLNKKYCGYISSLPLKLPHMVFLQIDWCMIGTDTEFHLIRKTLSNPTIYRMLSTDHSLEK